MIRNLKHDLDYWRGYILEAAEKSAEYSKRHFVLYGYISVLMPIGYTIDRLVGQPYYDTLGIRTFAFLVCIPLLFARRLTIRFPKLVSVYFVVLVTWVFPFSYGIMLSLNAAFAPSGHQIEMLWILQYFISLFLFIQLIHNGLLASLLWLASSIACLLPLALISDVNWDEVQRVMIFPVTGYLTALMFGILTNRNVDYVNSEKLRAASALGSNIAHELRTPLASIRSRARGVGKHLDDLVAGYQAARTAGLDIPKVSPRRMRELETGLTAIEEEVEYSNTIINMLLVNTSDKPISDWDFEVFKASHCVEEAVERYPFNNSAERKLITIDMKRDFYIRAPRLMIVHVLFNLIKNALYSVQRSGKGGVTISLTTSDGRNYVSVEDTGAGIPASMQNQIFERFFTTIRFGQGAGIGLSFCKMVMTGIGGEIRCESEEGKYTIFRLLFPVVSQPEQPSESRSTDGPRHSRARDDNGP